jgi:hypothetical protein
MTHDKDKPQEKSQELKTQSTLALNFDAKDVIDVLVSEQEQNIEAKIANLQEQVVTTQDEIKKNDQEIEKYVREFVKAKYSDKISQITDVFKSLGANSSVSFEIIDGNDLPRRNRRVLTTDASREDKADKILVALIICNKDFDRNTVDNTVSFYLESDNDEKLMKMNSDNDKLNTKVIQLQKQIKEHETVLSKTDRLVRQAKAVITKKAIGQDVNIFLDEFKKNYMQEIKQIAQ